MNRFLLVVLLAFASCHKKEDTPAKIDDGGIVVTRYSRLEFTTLTSCGDSTRLSPGASFYATGREGNRDVGITADLLKFYTSNYTLVWSGGREDRLNNYVFTNAADANSGKFTVDSMPIQRLEGIRFYLGVDSAHNHTIAHGGALDAVNGMTWTWQTGYIFFKHEGSFVDSTGTAHSLNFHYGFDEGLASVYVPVQKDVAQGTHQVRISLDLKKLYTLPQPVNLYKDTFSHFDTRAEAALRAHFRENFSQAFSVSFN